MFAVRVDCDWSRRDLFRFILAMGDDNHPRWVNKGLQPLVSAPHHPRLAATGSPPQIYLVTFVTHNSRVSERMIAFGVQCGPPLILSPDEQVQITNSILATCAGHGIALLALNVLPDHVHIVLAAVTAVELAEQVRKIKGYSSTAFRRASGVHGRGHLWAQKYHRWPIRNEEELRQAAHYVLNNHLKHAERWGPGLVTTWEERIQPLVEAECVDVAQIFR